MNNYLETNINTPIGITCIKGSNDGIISISVIEDGIVSVTHPKELQLAVDQLGEYFLGERTIFTFPIIPEGTPFQQEVWKALRNIPYGTTTSYLELSRTLGDEKAIRAVASANGKNPLWIVIPCHRVIGKDGSLTGYAGGLWRKRWLLEHENPPFQQSLF